MAKDFAKSFYASKAWTKLRQKVVEDNFYICSKCHKAFESRDLIVHHVAELTPLNINDPSVTLNYKNLILVCRDCHNEIHGYYTEGETENKFTYDDDGNIVDVVRSHQYPPLLRV